MARWGVRGYLVEHPFPPKHQVEVVGRKARLPACLLPPHSVGAPAPRGRGRVTESRGSISGSGRVVTQGQHFRRVWVWLQTPLSLLGIHLCVLRASLFTIPWALKCTKLGLLLSSVSAGIPC